MADLVRTTLEKTLRAKSLTDLVRVKTSEAVYLLLDTSGSMEYTMRNGRERIDGLRDVVKDIQAKRPVKMISFGGDGDGAVREVATVPIPGGGTPLHRAIDLAKAMKAGRAVVISDGIPDSVSLAMQAAKDFGGQIDVVFVGDPGERGEEILRELAKATGGTEFHGDLSEPKSLGSAIIGLLTAGTDEEED